MISVLLTHEPEILKNTYSHTAMEELKSFADVRINETGTVLTTNMMLDRVKGCDAMIIDRKTPVDIAFMSEAKDIVSIHRCAVDHRNIDVEAASGVGILVTNASPGFVDAVVELSLGLMLDLARGISTYASEYKQEIQPTVRMGTQLSGAEIGIVGYGGIGEKLAEVAHTLGMAVNVFDPHKTIEKTFINQCTLPILLAQSDFVHCLAIATPETENLMNESAFASMKTGSYFINVSRGNLVDEVALEHAIVSKHLRGAALDVGRYDDQCPLPRLACLNNVIATPHIGGQTPEAIESQALETVAQLRSVSMGVLPHNAINPEYATRFTEYQRSV